MDTQQQLMMMLMQQGGFNPSMLGINQADMFKTSAGVAPQNIKQFMGTQGGAMIGGGLASGAMDVLAPTNRNPYAAGLSSLGSAAMKSGNPYAMAAGAAAKLGAGIWNAYSYKPEAVEFDQRFSSSQNPVNTIQSMDATEAGVEDYSKSDNILSFGTAKKRHDKAVEESMKNRQMAQQGFNNAAQGFFDMQQMQRANATAHQQKMLYGLPV